MIKDIIRKQKKITFIQVVRVKKKKLKKKKPAGDINKYL